jgi:pyruvate dehydrogenase E2 component (dihydrolipoamide acetyltransferase)
MSDKIEIKVPNLGDITDVEILEIFVSPGDSIEQEDPLLSLETDKAVMEVPSPAKGTIESITVKVGDTISEGDLIGYLLTDDSSGDSADKDTTKSEPVEKQESSEPKKAGDKTNQENVTLEI